MTRTIFWNVDTQYDFMKLDGKLSIPGATEIEGNLEYLTRFAAVHGIKVVNTADYHTLNSRELSDKPDFKTTFFHYRANAVHVPGYKLGHCSF